MVASRGLLCRHLVSEGAIKPLIQAITAGMAAPTGAIAENDPVVAANAALGLLANNEQIVAICESGAVRCLIKQLLAKASRLEAEAIETTLTTLGVAISDVPSVPRQAIAAGILPLLHLHLSSPHDGVRYHASWCAWQLAA
jgi:hypothetical protein